MTRYKADRLAWGLVLAILVGGCGKEVPAEQQVSGTTHCIRYYAQCIDPIFHQALPGTGLSCSGQGLGCHYRDDNSEGSGGRFKVYRFPTSNDQLTRNFISAHNMTLAGSNSLILTKPLADGVPHNGGDLFLNTGDSNYLHIRFWAESTVDNQGDINPAQDSTQCSALFLPGNTCRTFP